MTRKILCEKCGVLKPMHPEDLAGGWKRRRVRLIADPDILCDMCGQSLAKRSAIAETIWRTDEEPGQWEDRYGMIVQPSSLTPNDNNQ